jgi:hypothetical protein
MFLANKLNKGAGAPAAPADAQFNYVTMLLHGDGTNGAQNNTFLDSSANTFSITRNGNTTQGSFSPYGSNWSNFFDGSGDYFDLGTTSSFNFMHNTTAVFTLEFWIFYVPSSFPYVFNTNDGSSGSIGCALYIGFSNFPVLYISNGGNEIVSATSTTALTANTWTHVAVVYDQSLGSNNATFYINGVQAGQTTKTASTPSNSNSSYVARICSNNTGGQAINGYISNLRITNTKVYTSAFTPSTTPLTAISGTQLLTCQSNRFKDNSTNNFTLTATGTPSVQRFNPFGASTAYSTSVIGGSGYFDGSGDYLGCGSQSVYAFGTSNFTMECWVYATSFISYNSLTGSRSNQSDGSNTNYSFGVDSGGSVYFYSAGFLVTSSAGAIKLNSWNHIALVRSGTGTNQSVLYINGVSAGTGTISNNLSGTSFAVGGLVNGDEPFTGYITNVRLNNTAVYTTAFTPPTAPLTAISGTTLLLSATNAAIFDNAMMNDLETVGDAQISTSVKKYGTGSLSFDGTGDWIRSFDNLPIAFGSGDFTVEGWIYLNNVSSTKGIMYGLGSNSFGLRVGQSYLGNVNGLNISRSGIADLEYCAFTFSTNTWYHIAVVRSGTTIYFFVDGTQQTTQGSGGSSYNFATPSTGFIVGANNDTNERFNGYIDDFRITKGYARYTANFTPPTAALPDIGPN